MCHARFLSVFSLCSCLQAAGCAAQQNWHHPLYLGNGDFWRQRIPLSAHNPTTNSLNGIPVFLPIGTGTGEVGIVGRRADDVRIVDAAGAEMLFAIIDRDGKRIEQGPISHGASFHFPVECGPSTNADYFLYFDNPSAWRVPDFLDVESTDINGGFEAGGGSMATGWSVKDTDATHRAIWPSDGARTGARCLRHEVDAGAEANWVGATRRIAPVTPGARCKISAWARAENVVGQAGWFIHIGGPSGLLSNKVFGLGGGTYDWKEFRADVSIPAGASWMVIGTSLRGTGKAWFDDLAIEGDDRSRLKVVVRPTETLTLDDITTHEGWPGDVDSDQRIPATFINLSASSVTQALGSVTIPSRWSTAEQAAVTLNNKRVPFTRLGDMLLFNCAMPPKSRVAANVYLRRAKHVAGADVSTSGGTASDIPSDYGVVRRRRAIDPPAYSTLLASQANLVKNPDFSSGANVPDAWDGAIKEGGRMTIEEVGLFGKRCVRMDLPAGSSTWRGWRQAVPVRAGRTYLVGAWAKSRALDGEARMHIHLLNPQKRLVASQAFSSAGEPISADSDWTPWIGTIRAPDDCAFLELHLTMNCGGTIWHDGVIVSEIVTGATGALQHEPVAGGELTFWPVNTVVKVFPDDAPPGGDRALDVSLARGEREPLQIALRSPAPLDDVTVEVSPLIAGEGARLPEPAIARVGYVPVDHPTAYFRSESPEWHRKFPKAGGQCDGWAGLWPDPLLPPRPFRLDARTTQSLWLTLTAPETATAGEYRGSIRIRSGEKVLAEAPLSARVWDFELPKKRNLIALYDVRPGRQWFEERDDRQEVVRAMMKFLSDRRLCADHVPADLVFKRDGDRVTADFTAFDRAAEWYFGELAMPVAYFPQFFYLFGWAHPPKKILGEEPYEGGFPYEGADRSRLRPQYVAIYQAALRLFWDHLRARGWSDKMVLYISDEPHFTHARVKDQMRALCDMIHAVDPKIRIYSSTWRHCAEWNGALDIWGVGHYGCFAVEEMARRKKDGDSIWFTTDGQMCTDTPFCAVERLLPHYCFHHGADAYEFWGVDWLTYDPHEFGWHRYISQSDQPGNHYYVRYPNGDGYLAYPGKRVGVDGPISTIRLEQARDGAEDYEYLFMLREIANGEGARASAARRVLEKAAAMVPIPNAGGRYSSRILPDPDTVPAWRRAAAAILEGR